MPTRDNFSTEAKRTLAGRAGHVCSNPDCQRPTSGAALGDEGKVVIVGVAAHIKAAAPGGPRYDPAQTPQERCHVSNGIWLCSVHAKQIDDDPENFTVAKLNEWKHRAEQSSALAILTLQAPTLGPAEPESETAAADLACRLGLSPQDTVLSVTARLQRATARDLDAFIVALKSPINAVPLGLRLIESQDVISFEAAGLAAAVGTFNEITVVAPPGTGKTTTLLQVARHIAASERLVATFIPLSEWSAQAHTLLQSVVQRSSFAGEREEHLKLLADTGRLVLVMDGWNELDAAARRRLRAEIKSMQRDYPALGMVMSTRAQAMDVPISGPVVEIEPLSETQQLAIARMYGGDAGERILDQAWRTRGLRDLVAIPLYLTRLLSETPGANLPATKEEVLRVFVAAVDRNVLAREALGTVVFGFQAEVLSAIAAAATVADSVTISDHRARSVINGVMSRLAAEGQISAAPQPNDVLAALVSHHLLVRTASGVEFQHQQFQEWFASHEVETLMRAAAAGNDSSRHRLRAAIINEYAWEEAVLFACERASRGGADALMGTKTLILDALSIDPMLAAEAIYRSSEALWSVVRDQVVAFASQWHRPTVIDRAVRFMIKTGRPEFAEAIWKFVANPNEQIHLAALRAGGRFRPSVLGKDASERIAHLIPTHRSNVLHELVMYGGIEGIETATDIALMDGDTEVMRAVAESLQFRQANRQIRRLLADAPSEVWEALAREGYEGDALEPQMAERLRQESDRLFEEEQNPVRKLHALLRNSTNRNAPAEEVRLLIETADFGGRDHHGSDVIYEASRMYPREVRNALIVRLTRKLPIPSQLEDLFKDAGIVVDEGPIAELAFSPDLDQQLARGAARLLGPSATGKLVDTMLTMREQLRSSPPQIAVDYYHRVRSIVSLTPIESFVTAFLSRASTSDPETIEELAELLTLHGDRNDRGQLGLSDSSRQAVIAAIRRWIDTILVDDSTPRRTFAEIARAVERLAAPELEEPLARMLNRDLMQWRQQRREHTEARKHGKHDHASEAYHSWTLQYARAFAAIASDQAIATLQSYLSDAGHTGFGVEAAQALSAIWRRRQGVVDEGPFRGPPEFSDVRMRRAARQSGGPLETCAFSEAIFAAVDQLLQKKEDYEAQTHALRLAAIGLSMPYGDKQPTIDCLVNLNQPYHTKLSLFTALARTGELLDSSLILDGVAALLEDAKAKPWLLDENQGTIDRWLLLLPFTDRPEATVEALELLHPHTRPPWRLRPLLSALGFAPSDAAENVLLALAQKDSRLLSEYSWFAALEQRGTLSSLRILLSLICQGIAEKSGVRPDVWTFGRRLAAGMLAYPEFRVDVYAKLKSDSSPHANAVMEFAVAQAPDEAGVMLLVESRASSGRAFDALLGEAIEHLVVEQRSSSDWVGAYEQISTPTPSLRKRLFEIARSPSHPAAQLASACLVHIDKLRDRHGMPSGEPRHPDIEAGAPWPLLINNEPLSLGK